MTGFPLRLRLDAPITRVWMSIVVCAGAGLAAVALMAGCFAVEEEEYRPSRRALELNNQAVRAFSEGDLEQALRLANDAIALEPKFYRAYANKAAVLRGLGRRQEAIGALRAAIEMNPAFVEAYVPLGLYLEETDKYDSALRHYQKAVELWDARLAKAPKDLDAAVNRAVAVYLANNPRGALKALDAVLNLHPSHEMARAVKRRIQSGDRRAFINGAGRPEGSEAPK